MSNFFAPYQNNFKHMKIFNTIKLIFGSKLFIKRDMLSVYEITEEELKNVLNKNEHKAFQMQIDFENIKF